MAKQTFTTGQVLTAAQMTSLQQTAMGGGSPSTKTASYVLVAADAGTVIQMNAAGSTTITVNTALFSAGDSVQIQNIGAGVCTITAGTATVNTAGSLALSQWEGGFLYFTSASSAIFFDVVQSSGMTNPMTTAGDTIYGGASGTPTRLAIGSTGQVLTVSGGNPVWAAASGSSGPAFSAYRAAPDQALGTSTFTKVQFQTETFDTDNCYDSTTNYRFTPNKAGYYLLQANITYNNSSGSSINIIEMGFNGTFNLRMVDGIQGRAGASINGTQLKYFNGTTDYAEVYAFSNDASASTFQGNDRVVFSGVWIRS